MSDEGPRPDGYEEKYMGGATALARTKMRMPAWFFALMGVAGLATMYSLILGAHVSSVVSLLALAVTTLIFSHLRMTVTATDVHVQLGLFGPKIAVAAITKATAEDYSAMEFGGWGIKFSRRGAWAYSVPGGRGRCVRIEYRTEKGDTRTVVVSSDEAEAVVAAIERARAALDATGVRVASAEGEEREEAQETPKNEAERKTAKG